MYRMGKFYMIVAFGLLAWVPTEQVEAATPKKAAYVCKKVSRMSSMILNGWRYSCEDNVLKAVKVEPVSEGMVSDVEDSNLNGKVDSIVTYTGKIECANSGAPECSQGQKVLDRVIEYALDW
jgi:hypothetical protein